MRVDAFDFELPDGLIAARPVEPRDAARLLVVGADGRTEHRVFRDLPELLRPGDVLAVNDTKVIPARLTGRTAKGKVEATLVAPAGEGLWVALARPARKLARGARIVFADDFSARTVETRGRDGVVLALDTGGARLLDLLERHGSMPLPPYIGRPEGPDAADRRDYQTVYAAEAGAVAAPTAGLHFTDALLDRLESAGIGRVRVTLHVGPGTFRPVRADDTDDHVMHAEWGRVTADAARRIDRARAAGGRVVAVGTTSARLLESATDRFRPASRVRGGNRPLHRSGLPFPRGRPVGDQLPPAEIDAVHAGLRLRRDGGREERLPGGGPGALPLLQLRRRLPVDGGAPQRALRSARSGTGPVQLGSRYQLSHDAAIARSRSLWSSRKKLIQNSIISSSVPQPHVTVFGGNVGL